MTIGGATSFCPHCGSALAAADATLCPFCLGNPSELPEGSQVAPLTNVNDGPPAPLAMTLDNGFEDPPAR